MHRRLFALAIFVCCAALGASAATHTVTVSPDGGINYSPGKNTLIISVQWGLIAGWIAAELTIAAGDTVNWVWSPNGDYQIPSLDSQIPLTHFLSAGSHSVVQADSVGSCTRAGSAFFASSVMSAGGTFSATFNDPGTFGYFCSVGGHCGAGGSQIAR